MKKLLTLFAFAFVAFTAQAQSSMSGDVNGDGDVSVNDVAMIVNYILGNENSNFIIANADINGDGEIDINDVMGTVSIILEGDNTPQSYLSCPDENHPHMIDLGLPSGTKWACCNVGASKPEEYGGYYAWGETYTKDLYYYDDSGYQHIFTDTILYENGYNSWLNNDIVSDKTYYYHLSYIGSNICGTKYDVAHVKWGNAWQMPTHDQMVELIDNVTFRSTNINGVNGGLFTSRVNGASIFLPYADCYERDYPALNKGYMGWYRTGTLHPKDDYNNGIFTTWGLTIYDSKDLNSLYQFDGEAIVDILDRISGFSVRPVWIP